MTAERFRQIRNVFEAAMDHGEADRTAWLAEACQGDSLLKAEVDALLKQYEKRSGVLDASLLKAQPGSRLAGHRIGAWEILREIGRGGMAAVYLARRADGAFQMQAAVKILNTPFADQEVRQRFQQEREILAQLDHPNIARLLDGGTTDDGQPYLVMEFIEGQSLTQWCDARKASVEERLRLFEQLCDVVHYLHEHYVIHRDLKPTNVLVNTAGTAKLLDFGISKLLEPVTERTILATQSGLHLLTPEYASPEQVRGDRITPQTDVYALGVILYELLTGRRPYRMRSRVMHEVVRAICEDEPDRPSTAVTKPDESTDPITTGRLRQASPERLSRILRGDLDEIVMKALRKAPERRYRTVRQLSEDLVAQAQGKSILARSDSFQARMLGFLNRHRVIIALVLLLVVLVASGTITFHTRGIAYGLVALAVIAFSYASTDRRMGRWLGAGIRRVLFWASAVFLLFFFWTRYDLPQVRLVYSAYWGAMAAYWIAVALSWVRRRKWAGDLIVVASEPHIKRLRADLLCGILLLILGPICGIHSHDVYMIISFTATGIWSLAVSLIPQRLELRQRGILNWGRLIPWDEIESWSWENQGPVPDEEVEVVDPFRGPPHFLDRSAITKPAVLRIERRRLIQLFPPVRIHVHPSKVDNVTRVMNRYLSEWPTSNDA